LPSQNLRGALIPPIDMEGKHALDREVHAVSQLAQLPSLCALLLWGAVAEDCLGAPAVQTNPVVELSVSQGSQGQGKVRVTMHQMWRGKKEHVLMHEKSCGMT